MPVVCPHPVQELPPVAYSKGLSRLDLSEQSVFLVPPPAGTLSALGILALPIPRGAPVRGANTNVCTRSPLDCTPPSGAPHPCPRRWCCSPQVLPQTPSPPSLTAVLAPLGHHLPLLLAQRSHTLPMSHSATRAHREPTLGTPRVPSR